MSLLTVGLALLLGLWTSGLARSKGRNGYWLWGGAALVLTLLPLLLPVQDTWRLLGMGPLFVLLFLRSPRTKVDAPPKGLSCPRCNAGQLPSQRYCVDCGWELGRAYPETVTAERAGDAARASSEEPSEEPAAPADSAGAAPEAPAVATVPETHFVPRALGNPMWRRRLRPAKRSNIPTCPVKRMSQWRKLLPNRRCFAGNPPRPT